MKNIPLTKGKSTIVDDNFYDYFVSLRHRFYFQDQGNGKGYAVSRSRYAYTRLHHLVLEFNGIEIPSGMDVDHINGDRLDNRIENLQLLTRAQNLLKKDRKYENETGYLGVRLRKDHHFSRPRYRAVVCHNGTNIQCGTYDTPEEAARARDAKALELQGPFANLNFPMSK